MFSGFLIDVHRDPAILRLFGNFELEKYIREKRLIKKEVCNELVEKQGVHFNVENCITNNSQEVRRICIHKFKNIKQYMTKQWVKKYRYIIISINNFDILYVEYWRKRDDLSKFQSHLNHQTS